MNPPARTPDPLPPRLTMDEYAEFFEQALRNVDPSLVNRQKELEERIRTRFGTPDETVARGPQRSLLSARRSRNGRVRY